MAIATSTATFFTSGAPGTLEPYAVEGDVGVPKQVWGPAVWGTLDAVTGRQSVVTVHPFADGAGAVAVFVPAGTRNSGPPGRVPIRFDHISCVTQSPSIANGMTPAAFNSRAIRS